MKNNKLQLTTTAVCFLALAAALNLVGGFIALSLRLPIYLDSIGTMLAAAMLGPICGMLPGLVSGLVSGFTSDIYALYYIPVQLNRNVQVKYMNKEIYLIGDGAGYRMNAHPLLLRAMEKLKKGIEPKKLSEELGAVGSIEEKLFSLLNELYIRGYLCLKSDYINKQQPHRV